MSQYPKRLIEVDLPIKRISAHARREKYVGTITSLHLWWARRPLAACRAVICASLWPDPADPRCPATFVEKVRKEMLAWTSHERQQLLSGESCARFEKARRNRALFADPIQLRCALLDFIADFANWDNSTVREYLETSCALTQVAHEALGGSPGSRPLVVDPFAGGGSIPLEALRVGADVFASDLNPVPVLLNKVILEYIPKYGQGLVDEVRKWGEWIKREAKNELAEFYPDDPDGSTPIAYLWARTIQCEGPGCGAEVPLIRSLWLAKKANGSVALQLVPNKKAKRVDFRIIIKQRDGWVDQSNPKTKIENPGFDGTMKSGSATCPCCGYTTQNARVRGRLAAVDGGASTGRLTAVVLLKSNESGRSYRLGTARDESAAKAAAKKLASIVHEQDTGLSVVPDEAIPKERPSPNARGLSAVTRMGVVRFGDLFTARQQLALVTLAKHVRRAGDTVRKDNRQLAEALQTTLALAVSRESDHLNSGCSWNPTGQKMQHLFTRQAIPIVWDFCESNPFGGSVGGWNSTLDCCCSALNAANFQASPGAVSQLPAQNHSLPNDVAAAFVTDPPYYDAVPYGDLSDFFYVWLRRMLREQHYDLFSTALTPKDEEAIWNPSRTYEKTGQPKDEAFYEAQMQRALAEGRRLAAPAGIGVVVFAHKSTAGWEAILSALINAGWIATASWPVDTEMGSRVNAMGTASLASSVHIICRPRENPDGSVRTDEIGDWRDILQELPRRIHEWMPRLVEEGVVGADAIFACLGPALEIFSRYSRVEKASGQAVRLKEYLEQVWAAVAKEALVLVFKDADTAGFEADARLTAMWLWTLNAANAADENGESADEEGDEESEASAKKPKVTGFILEYDAARKIAQGLGANLEHLDSLVEIKGDVARLLPVAERARSLFGKDEGKVPTKRRSREPQMDLFTVLEQTDTDGETSAGARVSRVGDTVLDRIHQSMILFAAGRGEALKRFLLEDGAGRDQRFWKLAQALSALYPSSTEEKRWIDGVLARKKGLGF